MKTTLQRRLTFLVGLLLLSLLVVAIGVQVAPALVVSDGGGGSAPAVTTAAGTEVGRGGVGLVAPAAGVQDSWSVTAATTGTSSTSGTSSTTYWLIGAAVAALIASIGAWALMRRRRQPAESASAAYCARHPEDSLCGAA